MNQKNIFEVREQNRQKSQCHSFCRLFVTLFKHNLELDSKIIRALRLRAWLFFTASNCLRIAEICMHSKGWFGKQIICDETIKTECIQEYNKAILDPLRPAVGNIMLAIPIISLILCVLSFKWRKITDYFFFIENLMRFLATLHLNQASFEEEHVTLIYIFCLNYLLYSCLSRTDLII